MEATASPPLSRVRAAALVSAIPVALAVTAAVVLWDVRTTTADAQQALDAAAATIGTLLAYLLLGRYTETGRARDLLLCLWLLLLGVSNATFAVIPHAFGSHGNAGASALSGGLAAVAFVGAAWLPPVLWPGRRGVGVLVLLAAVVAAIGLSLTVSVADEGIASADTFGATPDLGLTVAQLVAAALFAVGAAGASRHAAGDDLMAWLTGAALLAVGSRVDFAESHGNGDAWSTAGTILRVAFYAVLVVATGIEIRTYWSRVAGMATLEERRRLARDLHDGLAQELAFAATQARALAEVSEHPTRAKLITAATERALDESRRAIAALTRPLDEPLEVSVAQCAEEVCSRFDRQLVLDVEPGVQASAETREALLRVVRESVTNAARHSGADEVRVRLRRGKDLELRVEDDGRGFDVDEMGHLAGRFGMVSMRERVQALGGTFTVVSRHAGGTSIEVTLP